MPSTNLMLHAQICIDMMCTIIVKTVCTKPFRIMHIFQPYWSITCNLNLSEVCLLSRRQLQKSLVVTALLVVVFFCFLLFFLFCFLRYRHIFPKFLQNCQLKAYAQILKMIILLNIQISVMDATKTINVLQWQGCCLLL